MDGSNDNYEVFRDAMSATVLAISSRKPTKQPKKRVARDLGDTPASLTRPKEDTRSNSPAEDGNPAELAEFIEYLATEIFTSLPVELQNLSYHSLQNDASLSDTYAEPLSASTLDNLTDTIPLSVVDTLTAYSFMTPPATDLHSFMSPILSSYVSSVTTAPPPWVSTRKSACEICERDWIPLTYHHLIPRGIHLKVLKRGWHEEHMLNSVAWLCRACHSFVHRMASNEELARNWYTVERICERDDVQKWAKWVAGVRWKKRQMIRHRSVILGPVYETVSRVLCHRMNISAVPQDLDKTQLANVGFRQQCSLVNTRSKHVHLAGLLRRLTASEDLFAPPAE